MLRTVAAGSVVSWRHINLLGEYDFSEEKLQDSFGIRTPKILDFPARGFGNVKSADLSSATTVPEIPMEL